MWAVQGTKHDDFANRVNQSQRKYCVTAYEWSLIAFLFVRTHDLSSFTEELLLGGNPLEKIHQHHATLLRLAVADAIKIVYSVQPYPSVLRTR